MAYGLPSKQTVNAAGRLQARRVQVGCRSWTLQGSRTAQTTVTDVVATKVRQVLEIVTDHVTVRSRSTKDKP